MYDCSTDSYEENVRKVKEMADVGKSIAASEVDVDLITKLVAEEIA